MRMRSTCPGATSGAISTRMRPLLVSMIRRFSGLTSRQPAAVGVVQVPVFARLLRGSMLAQGNADYVLAAQSLGVRKRRIVLSQILPNSLSPVIVQATLSLATAIIEAAALSYLGLGNPDPAIPEWGVMLAQAQRFFSYAPAMAVYPAVGIIITALGFTLLGEAMREALDPKLRG